jgi:hypothetical protein
MLYQKNRIGLHSIEYANVRTHTKIIVYSMQKEIKMNHYGHIVRLSFCRRLNLFCTPEVPFCLI